VPRAIWSRADADDFVQLTFVRALRRYRHFTIRESATFQHYLRRILVNLVRDELRRAAREPESVDLSGIEDRAAPNALDRVLGLEARRRYRAALAALSPRTRTAVVARLEDGASYDHIARRIHAPSAEAARATVGRGVRRLVSGMRAPSRKPRRQPRTRSARRYR
jgi:RNA polymerase sigma factor (sigma-70 family)